MRRRIEIGTVVYLAYCHTCNASKCMHSDKVIPEQVDQWAAQHARKEGHSVELRHVRMVKPV